MEIGDRVKTPFGANFKVPHFIRGVFAGLTKSGKYGLIDTMSCNRKRYIIKRPVEKIIED